MSLALHVRRQEHRFYPAPRSEAKTICRPCLISAQGHDPCLRTVALNRRHQRSDSLMSPLRVFPSGLGHALLRADQSREREPGVGSRRCNLERQPPSLLALLSRDTHAQVKAKRHCLSPDSLWQGKGPRAVSLMLAVFLAPMCSPRAFHRAAPCPTSSLGKAGGVQLEGLAVAVAKLLPALSPGGLGPVLRGQSPGTTDLLPTWP